MPGQGYMLTTTKATTELTAVRGIAGKCRSADYRKEPADKPYLGSRNGRKSGVLDVRSNSGSYRRPSSR